MSQSDMTTQYDFHNQNAGKRRYAMSLQKMFCKFSVFTWSLVAAGLVAALVITPQLSGQESSRHKPRIITFDVPGAIATVPSSINPMGTIAGYYVGAGANPRRHGFLRTRNGTIISFDVPGAIETFGANINPSGTITGTYYDAYGLQGFVRAPGGTFTTFCPVTDVPCGLVWIAGINPSGAVAGEFEEAEFNGVFHGFVRAPDGTITWFDPPGFVPGEPSTRVQGINPSCAIIGTFAQADGELPAYVRAPDGTFTIFDGPGGERVDVGSINPAGTIIGTLEQADLAIHTYVRASDGTFTIFDAPGAICTAGVSINPAGTITGYYVDASGPSLGDPCFGRHHGFLRTQDGAITTFDCPGATNGGTSPASINPAGAITGSCPDANGVTHGFLRTP
jgi:hypothetical protein